VSSIDLPAFRVSPSACRKYRLRKSYDLWGESGDNFGLDAETVPHAVWYVLSSPAARYTPPLMRKFGAGRAAPQNILLTHFLRYALQMKNR
jgi:hypothetical protein